MRGAPLLSVLGAAEHPNAGCTASGRPGLSILVSLRTVFWTRSCALANTQVRLVEPWQPCRYAHFWQFFFISGGHYSVTALRESDQERVTVQCKEEEGVLTRLVRGIARGKGRRKRCSEEEDAEEEDRKDKFDNPRQSTPSTRRETSSTRCRTAPGAVLPCKGYPYEFKG